ncbi:RNase A-like domain-containing protein [Trichocoleus sp. DQ-U1]|uniref:RNase A-like domain-containing protein n=1 Tax=Trichocoleus sp. DQ-U1 TaxID=2933926 RepID=UPI0032993F66
MSEIAPTQTKASSTPVPTSTSAQPEFLRSRPFADNSAAAPSNATAAQATSEPPPDWQTQLERASRYGFDFNQVKISGAPPPFVQRKLVIGTPSNEYEQEANPMAEQVMAMPETANPQLQRKLFGNAIAQNIQRSSHTAAVFPESNLFTKRITPIVQCQTKEAGWVRPNPLLARMASVIQQEASAEEEVLEQIKPAATSITSSLQRKASEAKEKPLQQMKPLAASSVIPVIQRQPQNKDDSKSFFGHAGDFFSGLYEGGKDTVTGIGSMAKGAWNLTGGWLTNPAASQGTWNHLKSTTQAVVNNPSLVWEGIKAPYVEAWENGRPGEAIGRGTFEAISMLVGTKGVDKLAKGSKAAKAANVADKVGDVGKVTDKVEDLGKVGDKVDDAARVSTEVGDAAKVVEAPIFEEGAHTQLSQPGGLMATEGKQIPVPMKNGQYGPEALGPKAHPLKEHGPGKDLAEVEKRLHDNPNMKQATKFTDRATMETAIGKTIDAKKAEIEAWLKTNPPAGVNKSFDHSPGLGNLGQGYYRSPTGTVEAIPTELHNVRVVLKSDGKGGYVIQTAFPQ